MNIRFSVKRLDLQHWMLIDGDPYFPEIDPLLGSSFYPEIRPVFRKPGWYYSRPFSKYGSCMCWIEINGKAYSGDIKDWEYMFEVISASELNGRQADALHHVISERLATKQQAKLFKRWLDSEGLRESYRSARLWGFNHG